MNIVSLTFFYLSLIFISMQVYSRKKELLKEIGFISPQTDNGFDYLWILKTTCKNCFIEISCKKLSLYNYHSVIFSSSTSYFLQDATFKNYSSCPDEFYSRTDTHGFYFIYYYYYSYSKFRDHFNFTYRIFNSTQEKLIPALNKSQVCKNENTFENKTGILLFPYEENLFSKPLNCDCIFCSRYMHALSVVNSSIYVHGGISSWNISNRIFIRYINGIWERVLVKSKIHPPCLYSHSMDYNLLKNELVLFGGMICDSSPVESLSYSVWLFDIMECIWTEYNNNNSIPTTGHSLHVYNNIMYSFFGISGFAVKGTFILPFIQKFNLDTRKWMEKISINLNKFHGLVYHSTYRNASDIWIYGGLYMDNSLRVGVSNVLYVFNLLSENCRKLVNKDGPRLYLHSSYVINDKHFVIGGLIATNKSNNQMETKISKIICQFNILQRNWTQNCSNTFSSIGSRLIIKNYSTILINGGAVSDFKNPFNNMNFDESNLRDYKLQQLVNSVAITFQNCNKLQCESCVQNHCVWCTLAKRCISQLHLAISYFIGGCDVPILYAEQCPVKCEDLSNSGCRNCTKLQFCGWCEFKDKFSGVGKCVEGTVYGPSTISSNLEVQKYCTNNTIEKNWSFLPSHCPACNCNGHAECINVSPYTKTSWKCSTCLHNTTGGQCQFCELGFQGSSINGKKCSPCKCVLEKSANNCNSDGDCNEYCNEKGRIGKHCDMCDTHNNFSKFYDMCVIRSKINFKYVLNETDNFNIHINRIRFLLSNLVSNNDLGFQIQCINNFRTTIKVELFNASGNRDLLIRNQSCLKFEKIFRRSLFQGKSPYELLFTISGFNYPTPNKFHIEIVFTQKMTYTNMSYIFISLFACLFTVSLLSYTVFKMRQHMLQRRNNYRPFMIMERPFVKISLKTVSDNESIDQPIELSSLINQMHYDECSQSSNSRHCPLVCVEPYFARDRKVSGSTDDFKRNSTTAVVTFLFQSPKCTFSSVSQNIQDFSHKHSSCILIGSTLTKLNKRDRKLLLDLPTKSSSGNNLMVERDFDTSISPSAADELLITEV